MSGLTCFGLTKLSSLYVLSVCFSCCILVFPQQDGDACGVALGYPCFIPLASFPIQISEVNENGCPANVGVSLTGWRRPRQVLWPWVSPGGAWASGIRPCWVMHCTQPGYTLHIISQQSSSIAHHCTQLSNEHAFSTKNVYTGHLNIIRHYCTYQKYVNIIRLHCTRIGAHLVYCRLH